MGSIRTAVRNFRSTGALDLQEAGEGRGPEIRFAAAGRIRKDQ